MYFYSELKTMEFGFNVQNLKFSSGKADSELYDSERNNACKMYRELVAVAEIHDERMVKDIYIYI